MLLICLSCKTYATSSFWSLRLSQGNSPANCTSGAQWQMDHREKKSLKCLWSPVLNIWHEIGYGAGYSLSFLSNPSLKTHFTATSKQSCGYWAVKKRPQLLEEVYMHLLKYWWVLEFIFFAYYLFMYSLDKKQRWCFCHHGRHRIFLRPWTSYWSTLALFLFWQTYSIYSNIW